MTFLKGDRVRNIYLGKTGTVKYTYLIHGKMNVIVTRDGDGASAMWTEKWCEPYVPRDSN